MVGTAERDRNASPATGGGLQRQRDGIANRAARPVTSRVRNPSFSVAKVRSVSFARKDKEEVSSELNASPWGAEPSSPTSPRKTQNETDKSLQNKLLTKLSGAAGAREREPNDIPGLSVRSLSKQSDTLATSPVSPHGLKKSVSLLPRVAAQIKLENPPSVATKTASNEGRGKANEGQILDRKESNTAARIKSCNPEKASTESLKIKLSKEVVRIADPDFGADAERARINASCPPLKSENSSELLREGKSGNKSCARDDQIKPKNRMQDFSERLVSKFARSEGGGEDECTSPRSRNLGFGLRKAVMLTTTLKTKHNKYEIHENRHGGSSRSEDAESAAEENQETEPVVSLAKDDFVSYQTGQKSEKGHWRKLKFAGHQKGR